MKELGNLCANNVRFPDLRVKSIRGGPARPMVACSNLHSFVHEVGVDARRDFFLRMTSFSMGLSADKEGWKEQRRQLRRELPWLADEVFDLRSKEAFKDNYARAVCCAIPTFDLVIVDEGHNLKHGFREGVAARNRMLALAMGRDAEADPQLFPGYGRRAKRVLFLSATPIEESYQQLWNQLDVFGIGGPYTELKKRDATDETKKETASRFLVRRVTTMSVNGAELTKNQYRREWRRGGVLEHDKPIKVTDPRKRLVVALVQKKVAELLGSGKFNMSFQIGMLASFESFLQTSKLRRDDEAGNFDDPDQTRELSDAVKEGLDVRDVNRLARNYYNRFQEHLPHPKMDEVVEALSTAWLTGKKTLVFVRRVASVKELEQKLDERYDKWLIPFLRVNLPQEVQGTFDSVVDRYRREKKVVEDARQVRMTADRETSGDPEDDRGGTDTFFAWFFRGKGPDGVVSGARIAGRFIEAGSAYRIFFERNHVAEVLGVEPGQVAEALASATGHSRPELVVEIQRRAASLSERTNEQTSALFAFRRGPGCCLGTPGGAERARSADFARVGFRAGISRRDKEAARQPRPRMSCPASRRERSLLNCSGLNGGPCGMIYGRNRWPTTPLARFRESELRAQMLATTARLGHGLIDIYLLTIGRLKSLELRRLESDEGDAADLESRRIVEYLARLDDQRVTPLSEPPMGGIR